MSYKKIIRLASTFVIVAGVAALPTRAFAGEMEALGCMAGGPGASSCSIQGSIAGGGAGCSVSCRTGYACCSVDGCHCKVAGGGSGEEE